jgi:hypothetical protein
MQRQNIEHTIRTMSLAASIPDRFHMGWWFSESDLPPTPHLVRELPAVPPTLQRLLTGSACSACLLGWEASTDYARHRGFGWEPVSPRVTDQMASCRAFAPGGDEPEAALSRYLGVPLGVAEALSGTTWVGADGRPDPQAELWPHERAVRGMRMATPNDITMWLGKLLELGPPAFLEWHDGADQPQLLQVA